MELETNKVEIYNGPERKGFTQGQSYQIKSEVVGRIGQIKYAVENDNNSLCLVDASLFENPEVVLSKADEELDVPMVDVRSLAQEKQKAGMEMEEKVSELIDDCEWQSPLLCESQNRITTLEQKSKMHVDYYENQLNILAGVIEQNQESLFSVIEDEIKALRKRAQEDLNSASRMQEKLSYLKKLAVVS